MGYKMSDLQVSHKMNLKSAHSAFKFPTEDSCSSEFVAYEHTYFNSSFAYEKEQQPRNLYTLYSREC